MRIDFIDNADVAYVEGAVDDNAFATMPTFYEDGVKADPGELVISGPYQKQDLPSRVEVELKGHTVLPNMFADYLHPNPDGGWPRVNDECWKFRTVERFRQENKVTWKKWNLCFNVRCEDGQYDFEERLSSHEGFTVPAPIEGRGWVERLARRKGHAWRFLSLQQVADIVTAEEAEFNSERNTALREQATPATREESWEMGVFVFPWIDYPEPSWQPATHDELAHAKSAGLDWHYRLFMTEPVEGSWAKVWRWVPYKGFRSRTAEMKFKTKRELVAAFNR